MGTYYVRKTGHDDTGDGSTGNPWLTLGKAIATITIGGGHTIIMGDGTYAEGGAGIFYIDRAFASLVTVQSESADPTKVLITGNSDANWNTVIGSWGAPCTNMTFTNLTFTSRLGTNLSPVRFMHGSNSTFNNCLFVAIGSESYGCFCIYLTSDTGNSAGLYLNSCAASCTGAGSVTGFSCAGDSLANMARLSDVVLTDCYTHIKGTAIVCNNLQGFQIVRGTYISDTSYAGQIGTDNGHVGDTINVTGTIDGATFTNLGGNGHGLLVGAHCDAVTVKHCTVSGVSHGIVIKECTNCVVQYNHVNQVGNATGIYFRGSNSNTVQYNEVRRTGSGATVGLITLAAGNTGNKCASNIFTYNRLWEQAGGPLFDWQTAGDNGGNVCDYNKYRVYAPSTWGNVRGTSINGLPALQTAWAGYGDGSNDSHSGPWPDGIFLPGKHWALG